MAQRPDFSTPRVFVDADLALGGAAPLLTEQINYLANVLRLRDGARVLVFNGRDGEFAGSLALRGRKSAWLEALEMTRSQTRGPDIDFVFAPLKHTRLDYLAQKAVEMGACALRPVRTKRTQAARLNLARLRANVIEAAEQCGVIAMPEAFAMIDFEAQLRQWPAQRLLIFCDEDAPHANPLATLSRHDPKAGVSVLIGPEGGFDEAERRQLLQMPNVARLSLGPRILRADTAGVAALALVQATMGDWRGATQNQAPQ